MKKSTFIIIVTMLMLAILILFPIRFYILSFDTHFLHQFVSNWNHYIRTAILENQLSYSQGMQLIVNQSSAQIILQRALIIAIMVQSIPIVLLAVSLLIKYQKLKYALYLLSTLFTIFMIIPPLLIGAALIMEIKNK